MDIKLFALVVLAIGLMNVGFIEWLKGAWKKVLKADAPEWLPSVLPFVLSLIFGYLMAPLIGLKDAWWVAVGFLGLAITELCYQIFIQSIPQALANAISSLGGGSTTVTEQTARGVKTTTQTPSPAVATDEKMTVVVGARTD
jgi:hypothetical protein